MIKRRKRVSLVVNTPRRKIDHSIKIVSEEHRRENDQSGKKREALVKEKKTIIEIHLMIQVCRM